MVDLMYLFSITLISTLVVLSGCFIYNHLREKNNSR